MVINQEPMESHKKVFFFRKHPGTTLVILLITGFVLMDVMAGLVFIPSNNNHFRIFHPYYHHGLKPNINTVTTWDNVSYYSFYTNSLGLRDQENKVIPKKSNKKRFLIMGDSHTEGVGLDFKDTFTGQLRKRTLADLYEFLNAGVVSYSPKLYYLKTKYLVEQEGLKIDHLLVFIDISDIQNEIAYQDFKPGNLTPMSIKAYQINKFLRQKSLIWYALAQIKENHTRNEFYKQVEKKNRNPKTDIYSTFFVDFDHVEFLRDRAFHNIGLWYLDPELFEKWGRTGMSLESDYMQKLVLFCLNHDIKMSISVHPWPIQIKYGDVNSIQVQFWQNFAEHHHIGFINHFPDFFEKNKEVNVIKEYYQKGDVHWNQKGHSLACDVILNHLKEYYPNIEKEEPK